MIHPRLYEKLRTCSIDTNESEHTATFPVILYYCKPIDVVRRCITRRYGPIKYELPFINAMALDLPAHKVTAIAREPMVQWITEDVTVSKIGEGNSPDHRSPSIRGNPPVPGGCSSETMFPQRGDHWSQHDSLDYRWPRRSVSVAVIDTGVMPHPDLLSPVNRIRAFQDFIGHKTEPYDDDGHGTHIAGIICGLAHAPRIGEGGASDIHAPQMGARPDPGRWSPALVAIKALNEQGNGNASDILAAMQWILNNRRYYNIRAVNLSLGVAADDDYDSDPLVRGVEVLIRHGISVVTAAGNSGPKQGTISSPGICVDAITVGAADTTTDKFHVASFSGRGPTPQGRIKPDLLAPGVDILSLDAEAALNLPDPTFGRIAQSGTSMAAPFVSRAAAAIHERFPGLDPATVKRILLSQTIPLKDEPPEAQGRGVFLL